MSKSKCYRYFARGLNMHKVILSLEFVF